MKTVTEYGEQCGAGCGCGSDPVSRPRPDAMTGAVAGGVVYRVPAMDCASEELEIRQALSSVEGVKGLYFALAARTLTITGEEAIQQRAQDAIRAAGFEILPVGEAQPDKPLTAVRSEQAPRIGAGLGRLITALLLALGVEALSYFGPQTLTVEAIGMLIAAIAIGLSGVSVYRKGLVALRRGRLNINALMSVAVTGAFLIGQWPEAAMVMALYAIAELIEARSVDRARNAIKSLMALAPDEAEVKQADGSWLRVPAEAVPLEAVVRVKPGERVPLDGKVIAGHSAINQAPVTGESIPVDKEPGDPVFAGTINETGLLECRVTAVASNTTLARIIHAVEEAQNTRAPTQRFVDRFAAIYTPAIFVMALAVVLVAPWGFGWTWLDALYKALVLLVIACPCALVISTPVTVVSGLTAAARRGILIKGGAYLEAARKIKAIALDKTGTLTEGKPRLVAFDVIADDHSEQRTASLAASLAAHSDHPVSKAIAAGLDHPRQAVGGFSALAGRGVQGRVGDDLHALGNHRLIEDRGQCSAELEARLALHESMGRTVTLLASSHKVLGLFAVADTIKASSREAVAELRALGVMAVMLTGDNEATARSIATQAGLDDARGNLLPEDKLAAIRDLQRQYGPTAMTGDGINDAPALAQADMGIAMGAAGSDTAMEAADVVIMNDDLRRIPETIRLSRRTHAVLWQNIALALGIKSVFLILAVLGSATMWMAVFADMGASLLVVANGLRLLRREVK